MTNQHEKGYATGVFDLFHIGHLNLLKAASSRCSSLIVGVSTDQYCLEYKGYKPVIPFEERLAIISSIRYVQAVVAQESANKFSMYHNLRFDAIFVGDDWKGTKQWNLIEKNAISYGVKVIYLPYTKHTSSTKLRGVLNRLVNGLS